MYATYGSYTHADNELRVQTQRRYNYSTQGPWKSYTETLRLRGQLQGDSTGAVDVLMKALQDGYKIQGKTFSFLMPGLSTSIYLDNSKAIGGVRVVDGPNFEDDLKAEFTTYRNYNLTIEADFINTDLQFLAWEESIDFEGGGPRDLFLQTLKGLPQKQRVADNVTYKAVQRGSAVGYRAYPNPATPLWPLDEHRDQRRSAKKPPKRAGPVGDPYYTEYGIEWEYKFESVTPLAGVPTLQPE
jgi:hypothetical protein